MEFILCHIIWLLNVDMNRLVDIRKRNLPFNERRLNLMDILKLVFNIFSALGSVAEAINTGIKIKEKKKEKDKPDN